MDILRCSACGGPMIAWLDTWRGMISRCGTEGCRLAIVKTQPTDAELKKFYNELYYGGATKELIPIRYENMDAHIAEQHYRAIDKIIGLRGKRILDFGCGIGNFIKTSLVNGASDAVGVELNEQARAVAGERGLEVVPDINSLAGQRFDFAYLNDSIEHLRDPVATCRAINELLKPGGAIFISTPNSIGLKARLLGSRWDEFRNPTHLFFFTLPSLSAILEKANFRDMKKLNFPVDFSHHGWIRSGLQRVLVASGLDSSIKMMAVKASKYDKQIVD